MIATVERSFALLPPALRRRWLLSVPLTVAAAVLESVAALAIVLLAQTLAEPAGMTSASRLVGAVGSITAAFSPAALALTVGLVFVFKSALRLVETYVRERLISASATTMSTALLSSYLRAPWVEHLRFSSADLIRNATAAVETVCRTLLGSSVAAVSELLAVLAVLAVLIVATPGPILVGVAIVAFLSGGLLALTHRRFRQLGEAAHSLESERLRELQHALGAAKELKVLGRERIFEDRFAVVRRAHDRINALRGTLSAVPRLTMETVFVGGVALVSAVALSRPDRGEGLLPLLGFLAYAGLRVLPSLQLAVFHVNNVRFAAPALAALDEHRFAPVEIDAEGPETIEPLPFRQCLRFDGVGFSYPGASRPALDDLHLEIRPGEMLGIVGPSGSGKSTLVDVLLTLLTPGRGVVTADGEDIHRHAPRWRRQVGYVPQNVYLLDDTLRRNIALGVRDLDVDDGRLNDAVRQAGLEPVLAELPLGLETLTGERGLRLSGGQRQRVAIARALYHRPRVLVLDEATAALDPASEAQITAEMTALSGDLTLIVVAHRLSTVEACDRIVFLLEGRVADVGALPELAARNPEFRRMATIDSKAQGISD